MLCSNVASATNACIAAHEITYFLSRQCQNRLIDRFFVHLFLISFTNIWRLLILLSEENCPLGLNFFEVEYVFVCI